MNENLTALAVIQAIGEKAAGRYRLRTDDAEIQPWLDCYPVDGADRAVLRLKRLSNKTDHWKTIAIALVPEPSGLQQSFSWIAAIKDDLLDPESADLYFIGAVTGSEVSMDFCTSIETREQFCRKYILRPGEQITDLMNRTFLSSLTDHTLETEIVDPLNTAIQQTGARLAHFSVARQVHWRDALLSGETGAALVDALFSEISQNDMLTTDETSAEN
ncbi:hypothetical protein SAMN05216464_10895 [Mucilaginibacter pineti]|uniref:Uncharacterized protein n=1 Tax=Mucilaginibacter pineti TaxID=1391627 RepID=A0A1G7EN33_9SPHI|nr:ABC-three component system middle component 1 [Mucilaginibacter pineti]SDE65064.1 hypothetical protein SAMN05216464_10895 [Mucilaginibacter pineti]